MSFRGGTQRVREIFAAFVATTITNRRPDLVTEENVDGLLHIIQEFSIPTNSPDDTGILVLHWPPTKNEERFRGVFRETCDLMYQCFDTLSKLLPGHGGLSRLMVVDIYTRRRGISDEEGVRLYGSKPYSDDPDVGLHYSHAKLQIERGPGDYIILSGIYVKAFFQEAFGVIVEDGMTMMVVGGRMRQIFTSIIPSLSGIMPLLLALRTL